MLNRGKRIRLFRNRWLEYVSLVHPVLPGLMYLPMIGWLLWQSLAQPHPPLAAMPFAFVGGILTCTFFEYALHRFAFHYVPASAIGRRLHYLFHGIHHDDPNDALRLVMPPAVTLAIAIMLYPLCTWSVGEALGPVFYAGIATGYLAYDYSHFFIHHGRPRGPWGRLVQRQHFLHHFSDETTNFGVSSPLWDVVFGTRAVEHRRPTSRQVAANNE